ncbi:uncharacterized protein TNCV_3136981 [Trichonephila clavipes]|nr:uncharacterized protein TNCV_3136981 [Trichonephila clavipes]
MERYGYLILSSAKTYDYIHYELFPNILDCLRDVLTGSNLDEETKKRIYYFKILNNEEIDDLIHKKDHKYKFGKCWLHRMTPNKKCSVYGRENSLYSNIIDCIETDSLCRSENNFSNSDSFKHGFFQILTDKEIINLLKISIEKNSL